MLSQTELTGIGTGRRQSAVHGWRKIMKFANAGLRTGTLITLALLPTLCAAWFATSSPKTPPLAVTEPRPALVFATYLFHHGDEAVRLDSTLESEFRFRNDGPETVTFGEIERSCSCLSPRLSKKSLEPGEYGSLVVPVQTLNQSPGPHEYNLIVHYADPKPRQTTLSIKAVFPEKMVVVQPTALFISQRTDQPAKFDVSVSDFREEPLTVSSVNSTAWFVQVGMHKKPKVVQTAYSPDQQAPSAVTQITGHVEGSIPPGRHHVLLTAETNDSKFPYVTVPMMITGPAYATGETPKVEPPQIQLVASRHKNARRSGQIIVTVPESWELTHASSWPEELAVEYKTGSTADGRKSVVVTVELEQIPHMPLADGIVQLVANDGKNLVTIPATILHP